jgi:hypothetical protein
MNTGMPRGSLEETTPRLMQWFGRSGARWIWLLVGFLYVGFVAGSSVVMIVHALRADRWPRAIVIAASALLALGVWLRIWLINWRSLQADWPPLRPEDTGVWGVGGPGIRQPGATGIFPTTKIPDDEEPGGG